MEPRPFDQRALDLRPAWVEVSLDALEGNLHLLRQRVGEARILGVVKADAYGHGAVPVALSLEEAGVDELGVALVEEGVQLRRAEVEAPILVMGPATPDQLHLFARHRLTPAVSSMEQLDLWDRSSRGGPGTQPFHLELDTGMTRLGIALEELPRVLELVRANPRLVLVGLMSHLAEAEAQEGARNRQQEARFREAVGQLTAEERRGVTLHMGNSAAALHHRSCRFQMVRTGLALYGLDPARRESALSPVMTVKARIAVVREVEAGALVGYGGRWRAPRRSRLGLLPVGYADGYAWRLTEGAEVLTGGRRAPVVGAVSMDVTVVDLTETSAEMGGVAVLMGTQGQEEISAWDLAEAAGTIPYEVMTRFGQRLQRQYLRGDEVARLDAGRFAP
jgi:alanine racemase